MADLTLPIIGLTTFIGYIFSKEAKAPRNDEHVRNGIEKFEKPNGNNIYTSNMVEAVNAEMLERSTKNYKDSENPSLTGVLPPLFNTYSVVGSTDIDRFADDISIANRAQLYETTKLMDVTQSKENSIKVDERPMFSNNLSNYKNIDYKGNRRVDYSDIDEVGGGSNVSLLTGMPIDSTHNNMIPFFGSNIKQNVEGFGNVMLLDKYTGSTSTFVHKKEAGERFSAVAQDIHGTPIFTDKIDKQRFAASQYKNNEKPFIEERISAPIAGTVDNTIRPAYKDVDQLRVKS